jgi:polyhydroxybutyrate depolymerase
MVLKRYCVIALVVIMAMVLSVGASIVVADYSPEYSSGLHTGWMWQTYDGYDGTWSCNRTFEYYIPSSYTGSEEVPLLFSFHGMGSSGVEQIDLTKFDELAEQEGFIAVFPDSTNLPRDEESPCYPSLLALESANPLFASIDLIQWNIGTNLSLQYCAGVDDVGFTSDMVGWFDDNYNIDESRIYATGMSNGAQFSHYVALMLPGTFAGIAPVCSPLTTDMTGLSVTPVTAIMMMGTSDPIVPYNGEPLASIYSMNDTVDFWLDVDGITFEPVETVWGPTAADSTVVHRYVYSGGTDGTQVILFKIEGGGHTWPGGLLYSVFVGKVTTHIDGSAMLWKYLPPLKYYLAARSSSGGSVATPGRTTFANVESTGAYMFFDADISPTVVNLAATPDSDCRFVNWTGDVDAIANPDAATTTITIQPNTDYEITANFIAQYDLTIDSTDGGNVITPGEGLFPDYDAGTVVDLVATPDEGYRFLSWTGTATKIDDRHAATTVITMEGDYEITANFEEDPEYEPTPSGGMCFMATAAYGTSTAKPLEVLREFRDDVLLESTIGSRLVDLYYQVSPPIADFMSEHGFVRKLVRELMIDPIVWVVEATGDMWRN